jgi:hypothetical protein
MYCLSLYPRFSFVCFIVTSEGCIITFVLTSVKLYFSKNVFSILAKRRPLLSEVNGLFLRETDWTAACGTILVTQKLLVNKLWIRRIDLSRLFFGLNNGLFRSNTLYSLVLSNSRNLVIRVTHRISTERVNRMKLNYVARCNLPLAPTGFNYIKFACGSAWPQDRVHNTSRSALCTGQTKRSDQTVELGARLLISDM